MNKFMKNMKNKKKKGFTLVELIIVIAIIAVLAAMAIPKFGQIIIDSKVSKDIATAKNIQTATASLIADGTFGPNKTITDASADTDIPKKVDGTLKATAKTSTGEAYKVVIANGDVTVTAGTCTTALAPATDTTKKEYRDYVTGVVAPVTPVTP